MFVRALCRFLGPSESTFVRSRIENTAGHVWFADTLPSDSETLEGVDECDLSAWIVERRGSFVVRLQAVYSPCYDDCGQFRYVEVSRNTVAENSWGPVCWDPSSGDTAWTYLEDRGVSCRIPLIPRRAAPRIDFLPRRPAGTGKDGAFSVPAWVKSSYRSEETDTAQAFEFFDAARSTTPRRMILPRGVGIQILSAWIQMTGAVSDDVQVIVLRYEFVAAGHHGFMDPSTLTSLGFYDEAD